MSAFKTDIATAQDSRAVGDRSQSYKTMGDLRLLEAVYTATGTEAASGDTIEIGDIPVGGMVIPELIRVANEASMGGSVLSIDKIGDAGDDDRYTGTAVSIHSSNAAVQTITPNVGASVIPRYAVVSDYKRVIAKFSRTNAMTAGKKILFLIPFRLP